MEPHKARARRFSIVKLEVRIAPALAAAFIPSANVNDPAAGGAEHACPGLQHAAHGPNQAAQSSPQGCGDCGCD